MRTSHEAIIAEDAPTPAQLFKLASIGVVSATRRKRLKAMSKSPRAHFFIDEVHFLHGLKDEEIGEIHHRMAGRIGRRAIDQISIPAWSLSIYDTFWVQQKSESWAAQRTLYQFEWGKEAVSLATKEVKYIGQDHYSEGLRTLPDIEFLHAQMQMTEVTAADCNLIISNTKDYYEQLIVA